MRVVHWFPQPLVRSGPANVVTGLARAQQELGADVAVVAPSAVERSDGFADVRSLTWAPRLTIRAGAYAFRFLDPHDARNLAALEPDVVHLHGAFEPDLIWAVRTFRGPFVLTPHGAFHPLVFASSVLANKRAWGRAMKRLVYRRVGAVHAATATEADHVRRFLSGARTYVVPHGAGAGVRPAGRPREDGSADEVRLLFVGRLDVFTKGLDVLLDAVAAAAPLSARPLRLTLVGGDWKGGRRRLERRATELGVRALLRFTGELDGEGVAAELARADLYVQLSRHEAFPLTVAEALLAAKPVLASEGVGLPDELVALPHVHVVPGRADAAAAAITAAVSRLEPLAEAARASLPDVAQLLAWTRIAGVHLDLYRSLAPNAALDLRDPVTS
jgi:glycosyltransferase involved in cell wall biosynthesis